jgi:hypothetical protein
MKETKVRNGLEYKLVKRFYWKDDAKSNAVRFKKTASHPETVSVRVIEGKYKGERVWGIYYSNLMTARGKSRRTIVEKRKK